MIKTKADLERSLEKITKWQDFIDREEKKISDYYDKNPDELWAEMAED